MSDSEPKPRLPRLGLQPDGTNISVSHVKVGPDAPLPDWCVAGNPNLMVDAANEMAARVGEVLSYVSYLLRSDAKMTWEGRLELKVVAPGLPPMENSMKFSGARTGDMIEGTPGKQG